MFSYDIIFPQFIMLKTTGVRRFCFGPLQFCRRPLHQTFYRNLLYSRGSACRALQLSPRLHTSRKFATQRHLCFPQRLPDRADHKPTVRENIYTLPNVLTVSRILACPVLGWSILEGNFYLATTLLVYAGLTDLVCLCIFEPV